MEENVLQQILNKLGEIQSDINSIKIDVIEIKLQLKAHQIETDDNFTKLYQAVSEEDTAIKLLNKRIVSSKNK